MIINTKAKTFFKAVILMFTVSIILLLYINPVSAANYTQKTIYVSDANSPLYGKNVRLYYDLDGNLIQDTQSIVGLRGKYEIFVNKITNVVTIYTVDNGVYVPMKRFVCSNGGGNTPEGIFYTPNKYRWHELMGPCYGQWDTRITGGVLFHSVYYNSYNNNNTLSVSAYNKLGTTCSHGCVRLRAGDAKWIYDNCPLKTRVYIYSKNGYEPFSKPKADVLPSWHTWDPTDPNMHYKCEQNGCHGTCANGTAYDGITGQTRYYMDGNFADWVTGLLNAGDSWAYFRNGVFDGGVNGLVKNHNGWWLVKGGRVDFSANTVEKNQNGWWYLKGGKVDFGFTGIAHNQNGDWAINKGKVNFGYNGLYYANNISQNYNGQTITYNGWYYFTNGKLSTKTTVAKAGDKYVYVKNGRVDYSYTGVADNEYGTWFLRNGVVGFDLNGVVSDGKNSYYVVQSKVQTNCNGFVDVNGQSYYMNRGKVVTDSTVVRSGNNWIYITGGKPDYSYFGIAKNSNGYWFVRDGYVDFNYTGLIKDNANNAWYVSEGKINTTATGEYDINHTLIDLNTHEETYLTGKFYFNKGKIEMGRTDIVSYNGSWVYVSDGQIDWNANTVAKNQNGWWYVNNGKVDFHYCGLGENENGKWYINNGKVSFDTNGLVKIGVDWYHFRNGKLQTGYCDVVKNNGNWWYVGDDGKVDFNMNTVAKNSYGWWVIRNGKVDFGFNGIADNDQGTWYCKNGKVDFTYTGTYYDNATQTYYNISNGRVV